MMEMQHTISTLHGEWQNYIILICNVHIGSPPYKGAKYKLDARREIYKIALWILEIALYQGKRWIFHGGSTNYKGAQRRVEMHSTKVHNPWCKVEAHLTKINCA